jgi:hypothetical protein
MKVYVLVNGYGQSQGEIFYGVFASADLAKTKIGNPWPWYEVEDGIRADHPDPEDYEYYKILPVEVVGSES